MTTISRHERASGALLGTLIGDALGLGCHWYYDIEAMHADCGAWIDGYLDSNPDRNDRFGYIARYRYEQGLRAGDLSQTGEILVLLMQSLAECGSWQPDDYTTRLDGLLETLDGTALSGRFSDRAVRETCVHRRDGLAWGEAGSDTDTAEAAIWGVAHAAAASADARELALRAHASTLLTHNNPYICGYSTVFALATAALIEGVQLDAIRRHMSKLRDDPHIAARTCSPDITFQIGNEAATMGADTTLDLDPVVVCRLFGMNCTLGFLAPAAYFLIHRYPNDFNPGVLSAVNAGGNNMARAAMTGALSGALVGVNGIPTHLVEGLRNHDYLRALCDDVAALGDTSD